MKRVLNEGSPYWLKGRKWLLKEVRRLVKGFVGSVRWGEIGSIEVLRCLGKKIVAAPIRFCYGGCVGFSYGNRLELVQFVVAILVGQEVC